MLSCSGTQDVSVAAMRLLLILSVRLHCTQERSEGILCGLFVLGTLKTSFASLTDIHYHDSHLESKLSVAVAAMSVPLRGDVFRVYKRKNTAFLLCFLVAGPRIELGTS